MKAIIVKEFGGPAALALGTAAEPQPGAGQAVVEVKAAGVNPVDAYIRSGAYPRKPALPYTPGSDAAGVVLSVGPGVSRLRPGDRVYVHGTSTGAYAERVLCPENQVRPLPAALSFAQGAAIGVPYGTAYRALFQRARARPGESVLVHGASGGVGVAALQLSRAAGLDVCGTAGSAEGLELILREGARAAFDHRKEGYESEALQRAGGRGFDVIVEMLANANLARDLALAAPGGRIVVVGSRGQATLDPRAAMTKDASILGMSLHNASPAELDEIHAALGAGLASGALRPVIGRELPLGRAAEAHEAVMTAGARGKIVLIP